MRDIAQSFLAGTDPQLLLLSELGAGARPAIQAALDSGLALAELRRPRRGGGVGERERLELLGRGEPAGAVAAAAAA